MSRYTWLKWVLVLFLTSSQLLKKWTPVFKNYVKKTQDQVDCLSAFEEHFLEQDAHWAAMFKVAITHIKAELQLQRKMSVMEPHVFPFRSSWTCTSWRSWRRRWYCDGSPRESPPTRADSSAKTRGYVQFWGSHSRMHDTISQVPAQPKPNIWEWVSLSWFKMVVQSQTCLRILMIWIFWGPNQVYKEKHGYKLKMFCS